MELKLATPEQVREIYERDLKVSFPPAELKPVKNILEMMEAGCYRPWCLFDGEEISAMGLSPSTPKPATPIQLLQIIKPYAGPREREMIEMLENFQIMKEVL